MFAEKDVLENWGSLLVAYRGMVRSALAIAVPLLAAAFTHAIYFLRDCRIPCPNNACSRDASGYLQGAAMEFGKGRVTAFSEAAMFSAQVMPQNCFRFGFNAPGAEQNRQLTLNVMRWLARSLPE